MAFKRFTDISSAHSVKHCCLKNVVTFADYLDSPERTWHPFVVEFDAIPCVRRVLNGEYARYSCIDTVQRGVNGLFQFEVNKNPSMSAEIILTCP